MEEIVLRKIGEIWESEEMCKCERCKLDVAAIALNMLPPKYVLTDKGEVYAKTDTLETQKSVDFITAIVKGINMVKTKPSHQ
ncbi:MAG: competence protein ComFB [Firmicutes bacterium HGW-Firmicutes-13]|nr:MAG: competence protein ComFB [Firmicutes bacterium HGW-Firmicutes-13]